MRAANEILAPLLQKIHLDIFDHNELVGIAIELISNKIENENILILASLDQNPKSEDGDLKFHYFDLALKDLGIDYLDNKPEGYSEKTLYVINAVLKGHLNPRTGLKLLVQICIESEYDEQFIPFYSLNDEIELYIDEKQNLFRKVKNFENIDELIISELQKFKQNHVKQNPT